MSPQINLQDIEVQNRIDEYNKQAGRIEGETETERIAVPHDVVDLLLRGDEERSFPVWNNYRRSRRWIHSISFSRGNEYIDISYNRDERPVINLKTPSGQLLYGPVEDCRRAWRNLRRQDETDSITVDVSSPRPQIVNHSPTTPEEL
jgi:hypothetical protein